MDILTFMRQDRSERRKQNMNIGQQLKEARIASGLTQEIVAEKINGKRQIILRSYIKLLQPFASWSNSL